MLIAIIAGITVLPFVSHPIGCATMPVAVSTSLTMPNSECSIQNHVVAATMLGTTHGMSVSARTMPLRAEPPVEQDAGGRSKDDLTGDRHADEVHAC